MPHAQNPDLIARILAAPDDPTGYLVYADWLQAQGDPRGEFVMLAVALTQEPERPEHLEVARRHSEMFWEHHSQFMALLTDVPTELLRVTWRYGFWSEALVGANVELSSESRRQMLQTLGRVVGHPSATFLQRLVVGRSAGNEQKILALLRRLRNPASLRSLRLGKTAGDSFWAPQSWGDLAAICALFPKLEELQINGDFSELSQPVQLRRLILDRPFSSVEDCSVIVQAQWPQLENLTLRGREEGVEEFIHALEGDGFPRLKSLTLSYDKSDSDVIGTLATSRLLPRLDDLILAGLGPSQREATLLVEHRQAFTHLKRLQFPAFSLNEEEVAVLKKAIPQLNIGYVTPPEVEDLPQREAIAGIDYE